MSVFKCEVKVPAERLRNTASLGDFDLGPDGRCPRVEPSEANLVNKELSRIKGSRAGGLRDKLPPLRPSDNERRPQDFQVTCRRELGPRTHRFANGDGEGGRWLIRIG
jgi:hypothetical protein